ncbi:hypothetical protein ACVPOR_14155 [Staphylococcus aureus]
MYNKRRITIYRYDWCSERIGYHSRNVSEALVGLNDDVPTDEEIAEQLKFNF